MAVEKVFTADGLPVAAELYARIDNSAKSEDVKRDEIEQLQMNKIDKVKGSSILPVVFENNLESLDAKPSAEDLPLRLTMRRESEPVEVDLEFSTPVQSYVPENRSLRFRLSQDAYDLGVGVFDTERVPGFGTDNAHMDELSNAFAERVKSLKESGELGADEPLVVYELGAGHGLDGRRFLDTLQQVAPEVYEDTILVETDISEAAVDAMENSGFFATHQGHVRFEQVDAAQLEIDPDEPPLLIMGKQVLSAMPARRIGIASGGQKYEMMTSARVDKERQLLHINQETGVVDIIPPSALFPEDLLNQLQDRDMRDLVAAQLNGEGRLLHKEAMVNVEEELRRLPAHRARELGDFLRKIQHKAIHNFSEDAEHCVAASVAHVRPGGFVVFTDFMRTNSQESLPPHLQQQQFNAVVSTTVEGWRLAEVAQKFGADATVTPFPQGHRQSVIFDTARPELAEATAQTFKEGAGLDESDLREFQASVETILQKFQSGELRKENKEPEEAIDDLYNKLPEAVRENYFVGALVAQLCNEHKLYPLALQYGQRAVETAPHAGVIGYLETAKAFTKLKRSDAAEQMLQRAKAIAPYNSEVHKARADFYDENKRWEEYIEAATDYLATARNLSEKGVVRLLHKRSYAQVRLAKESAKDHRSAAKFSIVTTHASGYRLGDDEVPPYAYRSQLTQKQYGLPRSITTRTTAWDAIQSAKSVALELLKGYKQQDVAMVLQEFDDYADEVRYPGPRHLWPDRVRSADEKESYIWGQRSAAAEGARQKPSSI